MSKLTPAKHLRIPKIQADHVPFAFRFSWVCETVYDFGTASTGLTYLGQAAGSLVGLCIMLYTYSYYWTREAQKAKKQDPSGKMSPDKRLIVAMIGAPMIPVSLFWFGWTARPSIHWISPVVAEAFFSCGNILVFTCASLYLTDCYGALYGASAWSSNTSLRYLFAFVFPLFAVQVRLLATIHSAGTEFMTDVRRARRRLGDKSVRFYQRVTRADTFRILKVWRSTQK